MTLLLLQPLQLRCIPAQLSQQCNLSTKCRMSTKMLQITNRKSSIALLTYIQNEICDSSYHDGVHFFDTGLQPDACGCAAMVTPTKKLLLPRCGWDGSVFSQAAEAIIQSPRTKPQERLPIIVLTEISFSSAKLISLSLIAGKVAYISAFTTSVYTCAAITAL